MTAPMSIALTTRAPPTDVTTVTTPPHRLISRYSRPLKVMDSPSQPHMPEDLRIRTPVLERVMLRICQDMLLYQLPKPAKVRVRACMCGREGGRESWLDGNPKVMNMLSHSVRPGYSHHQQQQLQAYKEPSINGTASLQNRTKDSASVERDSEPYASWLHRIQTGF